MVLHEYKLQQKENVKRSAEKKKLCFWSDRLERNNGGKKIAWIFSRLSLMKHEMRRINAKMNLNGKLSAQRSVDTKRKRVNNSFSIE